MRYRVAALILFCCLLVPSVFAQGTTDTSFPIGTWNVGIFAGGGTGLVDRTNVQTVRGGIRLGRVLIPQHKLGSFEFDSEISPVDYVLWGGYKNVYGFSAEPVILKWNLPVHPGSRYAPFFLAEGGLVWTTTDIPPGDTSQINFRSGVGFGTHIFTRRDRAVTVDVRATHFSSASIGNHNPGINASLQFSVGYTWFKH